MSPDNCKRTNIMRIAIYLCQIWSSEGSRGEIALSAQSQPISPVFHLALGEFKILR